MKPCLIYGYLSPHVPLLPPLHFPSSLSTPSLLPPSLLSPPLPIQGDDPLNSADDDEDSDGEGAHFDKEDNIVCQFENLRYVALQNIVINIPVTVLLCLILGFSRANTKLVKLTRAGYLSHVSLTRSANSQSEKSTFHCSTNHTFNTWCA